MREFPNENMPYCSLSALDYLCTYFSIWSILLEWTYTQEYIWVLCLERCRAVCILKVFPFGMEPVLDAVLSTSLTKQKEEEEEKKSITIAVSPTSGFSSNRDNLIRCFPQHASFFIIHPTFVLLKVTGCIWIGLCEIINTKSKDHLLFVSLKFMCKALKNVCMYFFYVF